MGNEHTIPVNTPGITLVLGSGGARGFSFIGALSALEEAGVPIKRIIGASMGSIVGGAFALGKTPSELKAIAKHARPGVLPTFSLTGPGVFTPRAVRKLVQKFIPGDSSFENLQIPLSVICTDYRTGGPIEIDTGDLQSAVLGSSVAGAIFSPVERNGLLLIDGGYSAPVPVQFTRADEIVVSVSATINPASDPGAKMGFRLGNLIPGWSLSQQMIRMFDIQGYNLAEEQLDKVAHFGVTPDLGALKFTEFRKHAFAIERGYKAMIDKIPEIERQLKRPQG